MVAVLAQQLLHALDRVALVVEHMPDALDQFDILRPIVTAAATALHRFDLVETRFPEAQHMLRQVKIFRDFADGAERIGALVHGRILTLDDDPASMPNRVLFQQFMKRYSSPASRLTAVFNRICRRAICRPWPCCSGANAGCGSSARSTI